MGEERNQFVQYLYRGFESMKNTTNSIYKGMEVMAKRIGMVYTYFSTKSQGEMVEDLTRTFENGDDKLYEIYQHTTTRIVDGFVSKYSVIKEMTKEKSQWIQSLFQMKEEEKVEPVHIRNEATLIKPKRRTRRRYGKVWRKHVDLSDGGIFSSLNDESDSDDDEPETDLWDGGLFNALNDSDSDSDSDFEIIDVYEDGFDLSEDEEKELITRIESLFSDDSEDEEPEERKIVGYNPVSKVHNAFCWGCGVDWEEGHVCDSSFKQDLCDILQMAEKKTIGEQTDVPSIRACPMCQQLITHVQACKHMDCRSCKKAFCFVCLKPRLDSGWQCGSYSSKCPGGVAPVQGMDALPDAIVITKNAFHLYQ